MRVLIDECLPRKLKRELPEHECKTVTEMGWSGKKNGELLRLMNMKCTQPDQSALSPIEDML